MGLSTSNPHSRSLRREESRKLNLWKKNQRIVGGLLRRMKNVMEKELTMKDGLCYFIYDRFIVVIEVPASDPDQLKIYTCVYQIPKSDPFRSEVLEHCLRMNYMQETTKGATLGILEDEVNLHLSCSIALCSYQYLKDVLLGFVTLAVETNRSLDDLGKTLTPSSTP